MSTHYTLREATAEDIPKFGDYLADHIRDNGVGVTALFLPQTRHTAPGRETLERFGRGLCTAVGVPGWVRLWLVLAGQRIVGHCDLRAPAHGSALHRALLGMGVDREHRRRGLATRLMKTALQWAQAEPLLAWIDLDVLGTNVQARHLYERSGFETLAIVRDAFVVDGESIDRIMMTYHLASSVEKPKDPRHGSQVTWAG